MQMYYLLLAISAFSVTKAGPINIGSIDVELKPKVIRRGLYGETAKRYITVDAGSTIQLLCTSNTSGIQWTFPSKDPSRVTITEVRAPVSTDNGYQSTLVITNAHHYDAGTYTCKCKGIRDPHPSGLRPNKPGHTMNFKVYVNDPASLFANEPAPTNFPIGMGVVAGGEATFDCKPTLPGVTMELFYKGWNPFPTKVLGKYDPNTGIKYNFLSQFMNGEYICKAKLGDRVDERRFYVHVFPADPNRLSTPKIASRTTAYKVNAGDSLFLRCQVMAMRGMPVSMYWTKDGVKMTNSSQVRIIPAKHVSLCSAGNLDCKRVKKFNPASDARIMTRLRVRHMTAVDAGSYGCVAQSLHIIKDRHRDVTVLPIPADMHMGE